MSPTIAASVLGVIVVFGIGAMFWGLMKYREVLTKYKTVSGELKALQGRIGNDSFLSPSIL